VAVYEVDALAVLPTTVVHVDPPSADDSMR
jgi:hypothetical protein